MDFAMLALRLCMPSDMECKPVVFTGDWSDTKIGRDWIEGLILAYESPVVDPCFNEWHVNLCDPEFIICRRATWTQGFICGTVAHVATGIQNYYDSHDAKPREGPTTA